LAYGKEQRALVLNPFDEIDRPQVAYWIPEILKPAESKALLNSAEEVVPELVPFFAIAASLDCEQGRVFRSSGWCLNSKRSGLRPTEFCRNADLAVSTLELPS